MRDRYDKSLDEMRDSYRKKIREQKDYNKEIREKRLNSHRDQKREMEDEFTRIKDRQERFVSDKIRDVKNRYKKDLNEEREDFDRNRAKIQRDYNERLEGISNSYKNSFDSIERGRKYERERRDGKIERNLASMQKQFDDTVKDIEDRNYEKEMERNEEARSVRKKIREERNTYNEKLAKKNADWEAKLEGLRGHKSGSHEQDIKKLNRKHARALNRYKNELTERDRERTDFAKWSADELKKQVAKNKINNQKVMEERERQFRDYIKNNVKARSNRLVDKFQKRYQKMKSQMSRNEVAADRDMRNKMDLTKSFYAKDLSNVEAMNIDKIEDVKNSYIQDKNDALAKADEDFRSNVEDLREKLDKRYLSKESSLQKQIDENDHEKQRIVQFYENQLDKLRSAASKEFDQISRLAEERRETEKKEFINNLREKDRTFKQQIDLITKDYDRKDAMSKVAQDERTKKLIGRYEDMLSNERRAYEKEMARKANLFQEEYQRLVSKLEMERESLIAQYEAKIEKMRHFNG